MLQHKINKMHIHLLPVTHTCTRMHTHTHKWAHVQHTRIDPGRSRGKGVEILKFSTTKIEQFMTAYSCWFCCCCLLCFVFPILCSSHHAKFVRAVFSHVWATHTRCHRNLNFFTLFGHSWQYSYVVNVAVSLWSIVLHANSRMISTGIVLFLGIMHVDGPVMVMCIKCSTRVTA